MGVSTISPSTLAQLYGSGKKLDLIDVRTPAEFQEVHVEFARNVPLDRLDPAQIVQARNGSANEPLYIVCRSGGRRQQACEQVPQGRFRECRQRRRGHAGLRDGRAAVGPGKEGDLARTPGSDRGRLARPVGRRAGLARPSLPLRTVGLRRSGTRLCRSDGHLRHGHALGPNAVEYARFGLQQLRVSLITGNFGEFCPRVFSCLDEETVLHLYITHRHHDYLADPFGTQLIDETLSQIGLCPSRAVWPDCQRRQNARFDPRTCREIRRAQAVLRTDHARTQIERLGPQHRRPRRGLCAGQKTGRNHDG